MKITKDEFIKEYYKKGIYHRYFRYSFESTHDSLSCIFKLKNKIVFLYHYNMYYGTQRLLNLII
jgi:hypothetical protein